MTSPLLLFSKVFKDQTSQVTSPARECCSALKCFDGIVQV